jgi:hypothetical protein
MRNLVQKLPITCVQGLWFARLFASDDRTVADVMSLGSVVNQRKGRLCVSLRGEPAARCGNPEVFGNGWIATLGIASLAMTQKC